MPARRVLEAAVLTSIARAVIGPHNFFVEKRKYRYGLPAVPSFQGYFSNVPTISNRSDSVGCDHNTDAPSITAARSGEARQAS